MVDRYQRVKQQRRMGECNDCSVIAVSIAGRVPYNVAHKALKHEGRKDGCGAYMYQTLNALSSMGCKFYEMSHGKQPNGSRWTATSIGRKFPRGYYLVSMRGHIAAMVNGKVEDWTEGRRNIVLSVFKVTVPKGSRSK